MGYIYWDNWKGTHCIYWGKTNIYSPIVGHYHVSAHT